MSSQRAFDAYMRRAARVAVEGSRRRMLEKAADEERQAKPKLDKGDVEDILAAAGGDADDEAGSKSSDATPDAEEKSNRGGPQRAKASHREQPAPDAEDLSVKLIVAKLNAIRSGPSFKDEGVQARVTEYFRDLNDTQRLALFAFLEGLAETIAGGVPGDDARAPNDPDIGVAMQQSKPDAEEDEEAARPKNVAGAERVAKPESEEYGGSTHGDARRAAPSTDVPDVERDADEDAPVMIVRR